MAFCPFCGEKITDAGRCNKCGYTQTGGDNRNAYDTQFGTEKNNYEIPVWLKIIIVLALFFVSGGTVIGVIAGAVLSSSKDQKYKFYGKWLLKASLILLAVKAVLSVIAFILIMVVGVGGAVIMSSPEFAGILTWIV